MRPTMTSWRIITAVSRRHIVTTAMVSRRRRVRRCCGVGVAEGAESEVVARGDLEL